MNYKGRKFRRVLAGLILALVIGSATTAAQESAKVKLIVSAAVSLQAPLEKIAQLYMKEHSGVELTVNFGGSGALRQQIEVGAPVDLFISAAVRDMDQLQLKELILESTRVDLLRNSLVLIVSKQGRWIKSFADLTSKRLSQLAVGNLESVPAGMYARETLTYLGLWSQVETKAIYAKDVKQVLTWVATGNVDAGLVYSTDAKLTDNVKVVAIAPEKAHAPIIYPAAIVKGSLYPREAAAVLQYLNSNKAQRIFLKAGFSLYRPD